MSSTTEEFILLDQEYLVPYLKLPSGLPLEQAKKNAKQLKKLQNISHAEALKIICWGNGLIGIKDFSQAIPLLINSSFGLKYDEFGLVRHGKEYLGYWIKDEQWSTDPGCGTSDCGEALSNLIAQLRTYSIDKAKPSKFLRAVKDCISFLGGQFYKTENDIPLSDVKDVTQIEIDIEKLLNQRGSSGEDIMAYILASCYRYRLTAAHIARQSLISNCQNTNDGRLSTSEESAQDALVNHSPEFQQFGRMCRYLDNNNKRIVSDLLLNYQGWHYL
ncbi:hypothetical protein [Pseudoalteromonas spongiae]|uniref:hypothetical protein n=1 Tax=Pseudoalteromonas spongiae TaxID=298657 RepID=UPI00110A395E|nr:hypothetical protein [Pseudoalteromonas spongiae]TMO83076.1 hypothetical protein CWC15_16585 [Pseudoalteromonas spongiae]